jgi:hypothetical protein
MSWLLVTEKTLLSLARPFGALFKIGWNPHATLVDLQLIELDTYRSIGYISLKIKPP